MSAYIVDREHIGYLVACAMHPQITERSSAFRWHWQQAGEWLRAELPSGDYDRAREVGQMLWEENIRSVLCRYPGDTRHTAPGVNGENYILGRQDIRLIWQSVDVAQLFKAIHCYEYQSCEHGDSWRASEAHAFCHSLKESASRSLPGYEDAEWGCPESYL